MSKGETKTPTLTPELARRLLRRHSFTPAARRFLAICAEPTAKGRDLANGAAKWCAPEIAKGMTVWWGEVKEAAQAMGTKRSDRARIELRSKLVLADLIRRVEAHEQI